jgi:hypothetical protein
MLLDFYTKTQSPSFLSLIINLEQVDAMHDWWSAACFCKMVGLGCQDHYIRTLLILPAKRCSFHLNNKNDKLMNHCGHNEDRWQIDLTLHRCGTKRIDLVARECMIFFQVKSVYVLKNWMLLDLNTQAAKSARSAHRYNNTPIQCRVWPTTWLVYLVGSVKQNCYDSCEK